MLVCFSINHKNEMGSCRNTHSENHNGSSSIDSENNNFDLKYSRIPMTEVDSHARIVSVRKSYMTMKDAGRWTDAVSHMSEHDSLQRVKIAWIAEECYDKHWGETSLLVFYRFLWVPSMDHNLVLPLALSESGTDLNAMHKEHIMSPCKEDHSTHFE